MKNLAIVKWQTEFNNNYIQTAKSAFKAKLTNLPKWRMHQPWVMWRSDMKDQSFKKGISKTRAMRQDVRPGSNSWDSTPRQKIIGSDVVHQLQLGNGYRLHRLLNTQVCFKIKMLRHRLEIMSLSRSQHWRNTYIRNMKVGNLKTGLFKMLHMARTWTVLNQVTVVS